ncbi:MAG: septal ring lytic transglycosylase RlpA family protein [Alphaproteobacteria bacterium]
MSLRRSAAGLGLAALALLVSGCAETQLAMHAVKRLGGEMPTRPAPEYKVGKPYQIAGIWYYPAQNFDYAETGIASWYGAQFHGRRTANGEIYDMNALTAAHRTLPLPSLVRVTNLRNGRMIKVRVNDRGPFARSRIIDLSRRAAQLLGFQSQGTAPVRVEIIADESRRLAALAQRRRVSPGTAAPSGTVKVASLSFDNVPVVTETPPKQAVPAAEVASAVSLPDVQTVIAGPPGDPRLFVQAGAFIDEGRANRLSWKLAFAGRSRVVAAKVGAQRFYRVRIGPLGSIAEGDRVLDSVIEAGFPQARLVVD